MKISVETSPTRVTLLFWVILTTVIPLGGTAHGKSPPKDYPGPLGIKWGMHPGSVKSILLDKMRFVREMPAAKNSYHVVEQHYSGRFGGFPAVAPIKLRFFQGEFYYLEVNLATVTRLSKLFEAAVDKMREHYGEPDMITKPTTLYSGKAGLMHSSLAEDRKKLYSLYREDRQDKDGGHYALLDSQIMSGLWRPYAKWVFDNDVEIKIWTDFSREVDGRPVPRTLWTFVKKDLEKGAKAPNIYRARDF